METVKFSTPDWLTHLINNSFKHEVCCKTLLPDGGRRYIWKWCGRAGLKYHGVPGQACELLERYIAKKVLSLSDEGAEVVIREMKDKTKIVTGCCILLAAKMLSRSSHSEKTLRNNIFKERFQVQDVVRTETKVFQALDFYVPPRTTVEIAQMLAAEIRVDAEVFKIIDYVVSKGDLFKPAILKKVRWAADYRGTAMINRLHLAAAGVVAASIICEVPDPSPALAELTNASPLYITTLSVAILDVIPEDDNV